MTIHTHTRAFGRTLEEKNLDKRNKGLASVAIGSIEICKERNCFGQRLDKSIHVPLKKRKKFSKARQQKKG
jgi:hypothetical protein